MASSDELVHDVSAPNEAAAAFLVGERHGLSRSVQLQPIHYTRRQTSQVPSGSQVAREYAIVDQEQNDLKFRHRYDVQVLRDLMLYLI